jgi:hypothetical protein
MGAAFFNLARLYGGGHGARWWQAILVTYRMRELPGSSAEDRRAGSWQGERRERGTAGEGDLGVGLSATSAPEAARWG